MSVNYVLEIDTTLNIQSLALILFENYEGKILKEAKEDGIFISVDAFRADLETISGDKTSYSLKYGVHAKVRVDFYYVASREDLNGYLNVLWLVNKWLQNTADDIALIYEGGSLILLRLSGELFLNTFEDFWTAAYSQMITVPYKFALIPTI
jgi:hypothetical protein